MYKTYNKICKQFGFVFIPNKNAKSFIKLIMVQRSLSYTVHGLFDRRIIKIIYYAFSLSIL